MEANVPRAMREQITVQFHKWGDFDNAFAKANAHKFSCVLAADLYWMPQAHTALARSMLHFLSAAPCSRVLVVAGFHTGRDVLGQFFEKAVQHGLRIENIFEEDADGVRRLWQAQKRIPEDNVTERKRWHVIAVLRRDLT